MPGAGVALAMPMLTVVTIGPADHCATFRRIVSATASVRGGMARQQHRKLLAPEPRGTVAGAAHRIRNADRDADQHLVAGLLQFPHACARNRCGCLKWRQPCGDELTIRCRIDRIRRTSD
jgi:hypothetical protein